ncbi:hypothetical protein M422DRAFT_274529 [Sphaerobolus stellatus SS14]|uniref:Uncharacterized protein n=1 Tax=Sphaerobolus stellatus (strain SS14) TaxID=990650 RepID=A0A0C9TRX0_SPHS4|nr:hypothetical protein M422DRAFT_274529 [Sphaerobolus stellatus SS14]
MSSEKSEYHAPTGAEIRRKQAVAVNQSALLRMKYDESLALRTSLSALQYTFCSNEEPPFALGLRDQDSETILSRASVIYPFSGHRRHGSALMIQSSSKPTVGHARIEAASPRPIPLEYNDAPLWALHNPRKRQQGHMPVNRLSHSNVPGILIT